ncbi:acyltransferase family protein [Croceibacterium ferulae]|uniref:acyltransferase family protein n=1 Tax=Croceibacterium ferulae TaxID=1854641 RepID=UPI000EB3D40E|nr:heparan-alpha-glucosaminide N-acetyltransferase domain-containing protein [Croceibacterium ferulae]
MIAAPVPSVAPASGQPTRFVSLDVFRGLAVALMIVVNTAGPGAPPFTQLVHASWTGFTLADLVFPSFLFAVGTSMSFGFRKPVPTRTFYARLLRRVSLIFLLGFLMYWYPFVAPQPGGGWALKPLADTRLTGVLQRIALCYLLAAPLVRHLSMRALAAVALLLLVVHWAVLMQWSLPGEAWSRHGNAGTRLDLWLIGRDHLYRKDGGFDPEGLLGTLSATVNLLAGFMAGRFVQHAGRQARKVALLAPAGLMLIVLSLALSAVVPLSKKLWTGSFVFLTVGIDLVLLALLIVFELRRRQHGSGFLGVFGRNPLAIYLFSELLVMTLVLIPAPPHEHAWAWIGVTIFQGIAPGPFGSLLCATAYMLVCWLFGWLLDRNHWHLRL